MKLMVLVGMLLATPAFADSAGEVRRVLDAQVAAWNKKDLEGYMSGYWKSPDLSFYSCSAAPPLGGGANATRGWQPTLDRYRKKYQGEGKDMGTLAFDDLTLDLLGDGAALARGRWRLKFADGKSAEGLFTVIFKKLPEGWKIIHDHSC